MTNERGFEIVGISGEPDDDDFEIISCHPTEEIETTSDLIAALNQIISAHGDLPILQEGDDGSAASIIGYCLVTHRGKTKVMI